MGKLSKIGRIFYSIAIAGMGLLTICYHDFPYMLLPAGHPRTQVLIYVSGVLFILTGACLIFEKKARQVALLLASVLLLIFCFYYIPYELLVSHNYLSLGEWENSEKELALAGGALVIAGCFRVDKNPLFRFLSKLTPFGAILFAITIVCFSVLHFVYAKQAADYIPSWIPGHLFWMYFCGAALLGSGIAIILKIKVGLTAALLGIMILTWFVSLHIPRVIASTPADRADEITSALLALAYSGIAFVIAGTAKK